MTKLYKEQSDLSEIIEKYKEYKRIDEDILAAKEMLNDSEMADFAKEEISTLEKQKDYLGEFLFKKIEQHPITQRKNLDMDTIGKITGMILGIDNIKEIYDITTNNDYIESRINEALKLLNKR